MPADRSAKLETPVAPARLGLLRGGLLAKSVAETLFIGALAVGFYLTAFPPYFRGAVDVADATRIAGWAVNSQNPVASVEVQLYVDGRFVAHAVADQLRSDVQAAGYAPDARHGFVFTLPPELGAGKHEARVYVLHSSGDGARRTLQLLDPPKQFTR